MAVAFFYGSIATVWIIFLIFAVKRPPTLKHVMVAITAMGYSLLFETSLGEYLGLYYYINPEHSLFYIILSAVLLYPIIEIIYTMFLPDRAYPVILYTIVWIVLMLIYELIGVYTKTLVFTGWRLMPWSIITYIVTFGWINLLFRNLKKRGL